MNLAWIRCLSFPAQLWLGWLQCTVVAYFWWAKVVKLWKDVALIKAWSQIWGEKLKTSAVGFPEPNQQAAGLQAPTRATVQRASATPTAQYQATLGTERLKYPALIHAVVPRVESDTIYVRWVMRDYWVYECHPQVVKYWRFGSASNLNCQPHVSASVLQEVTFCCFKI